MSKLGCKPTHEASPLWQAIEAALAARKRDLHWLVARTGVPLRTFYSWRVGRMPRKLARAALVKALPGVTLP